VQDVRGNFFAGEASAHLADAQAKVVAWCQDTAGTRIHGTTAAQARADNEAHTWPARH
jgi:PPE-repeat protein